MSNDAERGTSDLLTADSAAPVFEGLLSAEPEYQETEETQPTQESPESGSESDEVEASTEPAGSEEAESEGTEESDEAALETPVLYPVKVAGEVKMVTLEEMQKGYSRTEDYTRKTQEVSIQRKAAEDFHEAARVERQQYATKLTQLDQALEEYAGKEPDWAQVQRDQPEEFPSLWAQWSAHKERRVAVQKERDQAIQVVQRDQEQAFTKHRESERTKLIEAIPEWSKPEIAKAEKAKMVAFAEKLGFTKDDLVKTSDHRMFVMLRKAMKQDELEAKRPAITQRIEKVKVSTPGGGAPRPQPNKVSKAFAALEKTGTQEAAAAAFATILED